MNNAIYFKKAAKVIEKNTLRKTNTGGSWELVSLFAELLSVLGGNKFLITTVLFDKCLHC